ncbi:hypothetical protein GP486_001991 [Trichoglossum hirsutum]|uniref:Glycosyl transferase CAP10 domain-containing protein n=1 Tax=Trichoglossum hirsutum TaxID=265104 RepID=A0A9P8RSJ5_9PEZI|nr:hypothetical protein GP486_001991 [Trichoglossum hirsutum]
MIYNGELFILDAVRVTDHRFYSRALATLHSMHRAIIASPEKLPDIEFTFNIADKVDPSHITWAFARRAEDVNTWLMPDFGFWSWPEPHVGGYQEVRQKMVELEQTLDSFKHKEAKLVWRGNVKTAPRLRGDLLAAASNKPWSDVQPLHWPNPENLLPMEEHCRYMFIAHTEGG